MFGKITTVLQRNDCPFVGLDMPKCTLRDVIHLYRNFVLGVKNIKTSVRSKIQ